MVQALVVMDNREQDHRAGMEALQGRPTADMGIKEGIPDQINMGTVTSVDTARLRPEDKVTVGKVDTMEVRGKAGTGESEPSREEPCVSISCIIVI